MGKTERFKDWHIETIEKMAMKPHGKLKTGKQFYLAVNHPAHQMFSAQDHAEAAHALHNEGIHAQQKMSDYDHSPEFEQARIKSLYQAAKAHGEAAKAKGLPKHNNPKR